MYDIINSFIHDIIVWTKYMTSLLLLSCMTSSAYQFRRGGGFRVWTWRSWGMLNGSRGTLLEPKENAAGLRFWRRSHFSLPHEWNCWKSIDFEHHNIRFSGIGFHRFLLTKRQRNSRVENLWLKFPAFRKFCKKIEDVLGFREFHQVTLFENGWTKIPRRPKKSEQRFFVPKSLKDEIDALAPF